jgi:ATP-dependent DNA helicase RecQ
MIVDILRGSKNEKIRRFGLASLSTWGIMADTSAHRIRTIIDFLIDEGCLLVYEESDYPVVVMGEVQDVMREERRLIIKLPRERKKSPQPVEMTAFKMEASPAAEIDTVLFDRLRGLRKEIAARESVPAYIVFSDATLRDMCRKKPASLPQFSGVTGVGEVKLEKYGEAFIALIRDYLTILT